MMQLHTHLSKQQPIFYACMHVLTLAYTIIYGEFLFTGGSSSEMDPEDVMKDVESKGII